MIASAEAFLLNMVRSLPSGLQYHCGTCEGAQLEKAKWKPRKKQADLGTQRGKAASVISNKNLLIVSSNIFKISTTKICNCL